MSEQFSPTVAQGEIPPVVYTPPPRLGVLRIAAAVFVGNLLCALIAFVLYVCLVVGVAVLANVSNR